MMLALLTSFYIATAPPVVAAVTNNGTVQVSGASTNAPVPVVISGCNLNSNAVVNAMTCPTYNWSYPGAGFLNATTSITLYGNGFSNSGNNIVFAQPNSSSLVKCLFSQKGNTYATITSLSTVLSTNNSYWLSWVGYTNLLLQPSTNCFADSLMSNLIALTNAPTAAANSYIYKVAASTNLAISVNTNCWLWGVTNIMSVYIAQWANFDNSQGIYQWDQNYPFIPISPHYCFVANHCANPARTCIMYNPATQTVYTNSGIQWTNVNDLEVVLMANTNPAWVRVMPDFTLYATSYYTNYAEIVCEHTSGNSYNGWESTWVAMLDPSGSINVLLLPNSSFKTVLPAITFGDFRYYNNSVAPTYIPGDSSSPAWFIINNEAILAGVAATPISIDSCGLTQTATINSMMSDMSTRYNVPGEALTTYTIPQSKIQP